MGLPDKVNVHINTEGGTWHGFAESGESGVTGNMRYGAWSEASGLRRAQLKGLRD